MKTHFTWSVRKGNRYRKTKGREHEFTFEHVELGFPKVTLSAATGQKYQRPELDQDIRKIMGTTVQRGWLRTWILRYNPRRCKQGPEGWAGIDVHIWPLVREWWVKEGRAEREIRALGDTNGIEANKKEGWEKTADYKCQKLQEGGSSDWAFKGEFSAWMVPDLMALERCRLENGRGVLYLDGKKLRLFW